MRREFSLACRRALKQTFSAGWCCVLFAFITFPLCAADVTLSGRVVNENEEPLHEAHVTVRLASATTAQSRTWEASTDSAGVFTLTLPESGAYTITVELEGFYPVKDRAVKVEGAQELTVVINSVREIFQSANVSEKPSPVDITQTSNTERLTGTEVNNIPYVSSHSLQNSFKLMPGVLPDTTGANHVNGASSNQVLYLLNGFDITDPVSGQFETVLAVEGIRSVDLSTGRYSPQYGHGSAGVIAINTENGTDSFHYTATNFIPGLNIQNGVRFGNWYPRFGVSGPIVRGKAWFSDTFDMQYTQSVVHDLPSGQNTRSGWAGGNLLHTQINLTRSNILFADFLVNIDNENRVGLGPLSPISTTYGLRHREYFASVKDQAYLGRGVLIEGGYAHNHFSTAQLPQGTDLYIFSPQGQSGNYFVNARQTASRDQAFLQVYSPQLEWVGSHQLEAGVDGSLRRYDGDSMRTGYQVIGLTGQLLSETLFPSPALFHVSDTSFAAYLRDTWRVSKRFQLDLGVRTDWDDRASGTAWSPHVGFSWGPSSSGRTRISGGYSITHDAITLDVLSRPLDQVAVTTQFNPDGTPVGPPAAAVSTILGPIALPRAMNWTLGVDHQISKSLVLSGRYLRRRGTDGFVFVNALDPAAPPSLLPVPNGAAGGLYQLTNLRRDDYDSAQVSFRQTLSGQYEWMASYTRSRAASNVVIDPNSSQPLQLLPAFVPMPWDAPNRFLAWAYLPLRWKNWGKNWAISTLADLRSGYPFSVRDPSGLIDGGVNSYRFPVNFDLNIAIERVFTLHGYRFALRGGINNILDRGNSTAVNNVVGSPQFLEFYGNEGRHGEVRIRFFGRASTK